MFHQSVTNRLVINPVGQTQNRHNKSDAPEREYMGGLASLGDVNFRPGYPERYPVSDA